MIGVAVIFIMLGVGISFAQKEAPLEFMAFSAVVKEVISPKEVVVSPKRCPNRNVKLKVQNPVGNVDKGDVVVFSSIENPCVVKEIKVGFLEKLRGKEK